MKYRGYYVDGVIFNSKADIDRFVKEEAIRAYKRSVELFVEKPTFEHSLYSDEKAEYLHTEFGMDWDEIEEIEISAMKAA